MSRNIVDINTALVVARDRVAQNKTKAVSRVNKLVDDAQYTTPYIPIDKQTNIQLDPFRTDTALIAEGTYGDKYGNIVPMLGSASQSVASGLGHLGATSIAGLEMIAKTAMGEDFDGNELLNKRVQTVNDFSGFDPTFYEQKYSKSHQDFLAKQRAITQSGMSETDQAKAELKLLWENPSDTGLEVVKTALSSGVELLLGAKALKSIVGLSSTAKVAASTVPSAMGHYISDEATKGSVTSATVANALGVGVFTGATTAYGSKLFRGEAESMLVNKVLGNTASREVSPLTLSTAIKMAGKSGAEEVPEELLQNAAENTTHNKENNRDLSKGIGASSVDSVVYGFHSGALTSGAVSAIPATVNSSKQLTSKATEALHNKLNPQVDITTALDTESDKFNPSAVYTQAQTNMAKATTPDEVAENKATMHQAITTTKDKYMDLAIQARQETDPNKKAELLAQAEQFKSTHLNPLVVKVKAFTSSHDQDNNALVTYVAELARQRQERLAQDNTIVTPNTTTTTNTTPVSSNTQRQVNISVKASTKPVSLTIGGKQYNAQLKNDGNGEGDYFEVKTGKGVTKYPAFTEASRDNLTPTKNLENSNLQFNLSRGHAVNSLMGNDLQSLASEFKQRTGMPLKVVAGFRSYQDQQDNLNNKAKDKQGMSYDRFSENSWVGGSRHHTGLALDFFDTGNAFWNTTKGKQVSKVLQEISVKHGFEMSYPKGSKQNVGNEAWEFTYRGKDANTRALTAQMLAHKNANIAITPTTAVQPTNNIVQDTGISVNGHKELGFKTPFTSVGKGNSISNGKPVKADTLSFAKVLDSDPEMQSVMNAFTSFNGGSSHKGGEKTHYNGFKFDLDLKNGDSIATYEKAVNRVQALAKQHGYDVTVLAEGKDWDKLGKANFIHGNGGTHLDVKVSGRGNTAQAPTGAISDGNTFTSNDFTNAKGVSNTQKRNMGMVANALDKYDISPEFKKVMLGQIGREGSFDFNNLRSAHADAANGKSNIGIISFQKSRHTALKNYLQSKGLYSNGQVTGTDAQLVQANIDFMMHELNNDSSYKRTKALMKSSDKKAIWEATSDNYIAWDRAGKHHDASKGHTNFNTFYTAANSGTSSTQQQISQSSTDDSLASIGKLKSQIDDLTDQLHKSNDSSEIDDLKERVTQLQDELHSEQSQQTNATDTLNTPTIINDVSEDDENKQVMQEVFSRASTIKVEHLEQIINSGLLSEKQKQSLRVMLDVKRAIADTNNSEGVNSEITAGRKGTTLEDTNLGLKDYGNILTTAIEQNDSPTIDRYMGHLNRFNNSKVNKVQALEQALTYNPHNNKPVAIIPDNEGNWSVADNIRVTDNPELKQAGAFQVWKNNPINDLMRNEAVQQTKVRDSFQALIDNHRENGYITPSTTSTADNTKSDTSDVINGTVSSNTAKMDVPSVTVPTNLTTPPQATAVANNRGNSNSNIKQTMNYDLNTIGDGIWLERGKSQEGYPESMSMLTNPKYKDKDLVGKQGWLANPYNVNLNKANDTKGFNVSSQEVATQKYVDLFKDLFTGQKNVATRTVATFAPAVMNLKGKTLFTRNANDESVKFLDQVINQMPDDINQAKAWVNSVEGFKDGNIQFKQESNTSSLSNTSPITDTTDNNTVISEINDSNTKTNIKDKITQAKAKVNQSDSIDEKSAQDALDDYYTSQQDTDFETYYDTYEESSEDTIDETVEDTLVQHGNIDVLTSRLDKNISPEEYLAEAKLSKTLIDDKLVITLTENLLAYLPNQLIKLDTEAKEHSVSDNVIILANTDNALEYLAEQVLKEAMGNIPNMYISAEESTALFKLNKSILSIKDSLTQALSNEDLSESDKTIITNLLTLDNNELLQSVLDKQVRVLLHKVTTKDSNIKTSIYKRIVKAIGSYFGMSSIKLQTTLEKVINTIGLATQLNTSLNDLDFTKSITGQLSVIQDTIKYPDYTRYSPKRLEKEGVFFIPPPNKRYMSKAKAKSISQAKLKEFLDKVKTLPKTEQGLDEALQYWEDLVNQLQSNNYQISSDAIKHVQTGLAYTFSNATTRMSREYEKDLYERNLITASFTQSNNNPLASISDFVQKLSINLMQGVNAVTDVIPNLNQRNQVQDFIKFNEMFSKHLRNTFAVSSNDKFQFKDLKGFLSQGEKQLDNNLLSAISLEVYNWIIENGNNTFNTQDDIAHIIGLEPDDITNFHSETYSTFAHIGTPDRFIYSKLGKAIYNTLGLKLDENANYEFDVRLQSSLGDWALNALRETGLVHEHQMSKRDVLSHKRMYSDDITLQPYYELINEEIYEKTIIYQRDMTAEQLKKYADKIIDPIDADINTMGNYISIVDLDGENQSEDLVSIVDKSKGTQGFLQQLFNSMGGLRQPLLMKPTKSNDKIKRAEVVMNKKQRSDWDKVQEQSFRINPKIYELFTGLHSKNADSFLDMINARVSENTLKTKLEIRQKAEQAKADGRLKEFNYMVDFVSGLEKENSEYQPFWDTISGSVNLRTIYDSNVVNIQSNKVQRAVIELSNSDSEVNKKEPMYGKQGITVHGRFFQALAEKAEGTEDSVKEILNADDSKLKDVYSRGYTFDKIQGEHFIPAFIKYLKTDKDVLKGVDAMTVALNNSNDLTQEQVNAIATVVSKWDMGAESLRALAEYTMYLNAKETYTTYITLGSDGINNGIALSHMLTGNITEDSAHMFGLIHVNLKEQFNTYQETRTNKELSDYYEGFLPYIDAIKERASKTEIGKTIVNLGTSLSGRKAAKVIILPFGYGAMAGRLTAVSFERLKEDIHDLIEDIYSDYETNPETALQDWKKLNEDLKIIARTDEDVLPDIDIALKFAFSNKEDVSLYTSYREYIGEGVANEGLASYASEFIKVRDLNIDMQGKASILYIQYRKAYIESKEQELLEKLLPNVIESVNANPKYTNLTAKEKETKASNLAKSQAKLVGLSKVEIENIEKELEVIKPRLQTVWTFDINNLFNRDESGIDLYNISTSVKNDDITVGITNKSDGSIKQNRLVVSQKEIETIGVKANALQTQSIDGYIAAIANSLSTVGLNIHDALNTGLKSFKELTTLQNRATFDATVNYHQQTANLATLLSTIKQFKTTLENDRSLSIPKELLQSKDQEIDVIARHGKEDGLSHDDIFHAMLTVMIDKGVDSDIRKLNQWKDIYTVQQYGGENGEIKLSKNDYKLLQEQIKLLENARKELHKVNDDVFKLKTYTKSNTPRNKLLTQQEKVSNVIYKKEQDKADKANKFIGFGKSGSSTHVYRQDFGNMANTSNYESTDIVFVSTNGNPSDKYRYKPMYRTFRKELDIAIKAGVTFITDNQYNRNRDYNIGERELAEYLTDKGYTANNGEGVWTNKTSTNNSVSNVLGNKTQSKNVKLPQDYKKPEGKIFDALPEFKKENPKGLVAFRVNNSKSLIQNLSEQNAIGNPFNWKTSTAEIATNKFMDWLITGNNFNEPLATEEYRQAIINLLKDSKGKNILYYKELGYPSHATVIDYLANEYNWSENESRQSDTTTERDNESGTSDTRTGSNTSINTSDNDGRDDGNVTTENQTQSVQREQSLDIINIKSNKSNMTHQVNKNLLNKTLPADRNIKELININQDISSTEQGTETRDTTDSREGQTTTVSKQDIRDKQITLILSASILELTTIVNGLETSTEAKELFHILIDLVNTYNPNLTISVKALDNDKHEATYNSDNSITLNSKIYSDSIIERSPEAKLRAINHELFHALTETGLTKDTQAVHDLTAMYNQLKAKDVNNKFSNELENINEFVAYGTTDPQFAQYIADNLNLKEAGIKTLGSIASVFRAFLTTVYNMLGFEDNKAYKTFLGAVNKTIEVYYKNHTGSTKESTQAKPSTISENTPTDTINSMSSLEVLAQLDTGTISSEFNRHLDSISKKLLNTFYTANPQQVNKSVGSLTSKATNAGFNLSDKEIATYEIVKAMVESYKESQTGNTAFNELYKIYTELFNDPNFTYESFLPNPSTATKAEKQLAKHKYDFLFGAKGDNLKGAYLPKFIALSLTSEEMNSLVSKPRQKKERSTDKPLMDRIMKVLYNIMDFFTNKLINRVSGNMDTQLFGLLNKLQSIDTKARNTKINVLEQLWGIKETINEVANSFVKSAITAGIEKASLETSSNDYVRATAKIVRSALTTDIAESTRLLTELANDKHNPNSRVGVVGETFNELAKTTPLQNILEYYVRMTSRVAQTRQSLKADSKKSMLKDFDTKNLTVKNRNSLTTVGLRTDIASLLNHGINIAQVIGLISDDTKRANKVSSLEAKIETMANGNDMLMQAKSLASYMVLGITPSHLVKNSQAIAMGLGTNYVIDLKDINPNLLSDIDTLVSLYAIDYAPKVDLNAVKQLIQTDRKGVESMLKFHQQVANTAYEDFTDNPFNYMKGYLPDINDSRRQIQFVTSEEEVKEAQKMGWERVSDVYLVKDSSDKTEDNRILMVHKDISFTPIISGAVDLKDTSARGTVVYSADDFINIKRTIKEKSSDRARRNQQSYKYYDPRTASGSMIASYATDGSLMDYSYEMQGFVKDNFLRRNNDAFTLLPTLFANIQFKPEINKLQRELPHVLHKDFEESYRKFPKQFILLSPESSDPEVVQQWAMLPYDFRQEAIKLFGTGNPIAIRRNIYNATFGFRQYSVIKMFDKLSGEKNFFEKLITGIFGAMFQEKGKMRALQLERIVQGIVGYAKETIVVRSGKVLLGNIVSNAFLLMLHGVNPIQMTKDMSFAYNEGRRYNGWKSRVNQINVELTMNRGKPSEVSKLKQERMQLENRMKESKLHRYMEAGLMSTIVEDVDGLNSDTDYMTDFQEKVDKYTRKIPEPVKVVSNFVMMGKTSSIFQFLADATQFSDFGAKYALAEYNMNSKGMTFEKAITESQTNFVNFDVPTNVGLDYMNKMGFFMFTKFFLRFQKALTKLLRDKPASLITQHLMAENLLGTVGVLDPFMPLHIGNNPFHPSALTVTGAHGDMLTMNVISGMW